MAAGEGCGVTVRISTTRDNLIKVNGTAAGRLIRRNGQHRGLATQWWAEISFADAKSIGPVESRSAALAEISEHIRTVMREG
jgi:hypothetical protein